MRGSLKTQITAALKCCTRIKESRHKQKQLNHGRSPFIHSMGTFDKTARRLWPLHAWLGSRGVKDLELLTDDLVRRYLDDRLAYHLERGNSRQAFKVEVAALGNLERGLNLFSARHRAAPVRYDFSKARSSFTGRARKLPRATSEYESRALSDPMALIAALEEPHHKLMAALQYHCGCRTEGVGAPRRDYPGGNPLKKENFAGAEGRLLPTQKDPVTGERVRPFWTKEKGGKVAWKYCPEALAREVLRWIEGHPEGLGESYAVYLAAVNKAMRETCQTVRGRGTHALRFNFARRRYKQCLLAGMGDEEAKRFVSQEMSHNRPDITEGYYG
ncbi:MAG: hypothetical protein LIP28_11145 [Deltaproteobacteria bacterium]|nr:hypothetical protein [Deltaproteobacteria bacterium]